MTVEEDEESYAFLKSEPDPDAVITAIEKMIHEQFPDEGGAQNISEFMIDYCQSEILRFREALLEAWMK
jgi:hypothetical protein